MAYWEWTADLDLGIDVIDNQHRRIVDYMNTLDEAAKNGDADKVGEVIVEMMDYTVTHFAFEESLMQKGEYPVYEAHKAVHDRFTQKIHSYRDEYVRGEDVSKRLLGDLRVWLTNHIKRDDKDYVPLVKARIDEHRQSGWLGKALKRFFG